MGLPFPNGGSSLSGSGDGPCADATTAPAGNDTAPPQLPRTPVGAVSEPLSDLLRYTRLIKPFPIRQLADVLYQVIAYGNGINAKLINVQIAQPTDPESWVETLDAMLLDLWSLAQICEETAVHLNRMIDEADTQAERGEAAVRAIIAGLRAD